MSLKIVTTIFFLFSTLFFICVGLLSFGNAGDNSSFILFLQVIWPIAALLNSAAILGGIFAYDRWIAAYLDQIRLEQVVQDPTEIMEKFATSKTKYIIVQAIIFLLFIFPIFLCTFFILFKDAKNDPQWMTALQVFWCFPIGLIGLMLVLACCGCCCLCLLKIKDRSIPIIPEDTSSETRPFANQSTASV
jgi:hypothetical protein